jgi:TatD DNase family protein
LNFVDTHCHLYFDLFQNDLQQVLDNARSEGVTRILVPGISVETSRQAVTLCEQNADLFAAVGVHPNDAMTWERHSLHMLKDLVSHPKVVAIGEIGLDYYRDHAPRDIQREVFQAQLDLAEETGLPVLVHNRNSWEDSWKMLQKWHEELISTRRPLAENPGILHSFDGNIDAARQAVQKNFYIGVGGPVTYTKAVDRQEVVSKLPLDSILLETDAPFLTPHPHRGKRNEPAYIPLIAKKIAELCKISLEDVAEKTTCSAKRLLKWEVLD